MSIYEIKGATPVKIKLSQFLTLSNTRNTLTLNNTHNSLKNKTFSFSIIYALLPLIHKIILVL